MLFFALAAIVLFPIEIAVILYSSKKDFGSYSLKSAFTNQEKTNWKQALIYGSILFAFAGLMSITVAPFENWITAPISNKLLEIIPVYFDWTNMEYIRTYPKNMLIIT